MWDGVGEDIGSASIGGDNNAVGVILRNFLLHKKERDGKVIARFDLRKHSPFVLFDAQNGSRVGRGTILTLGVVGRPGIEPG